MINLTKLYTNPLFWVGVVGVFFINFSSLAWMFDGEPRTAPILLFLMPVALTLLRVDSLYDFNSPASYIFSGTVWLLEAAAVAILFFWKSKLTQRRIVMIGTGLLLLLVAQFAGCAAAYIMMAGYEI